MLVAAFHVASQLPFYQSAQLTAVRLLQQRQLRLEQPVLRLRRQRLVRFWQPVVRLRFWPRQRRLVRLLGPQQPVLGLRRQ